MTDPHTAGTDPLVTIVAEAFRKAAVNGRIPSTREPLPFLSLADIAVAAVRAHQNTTGQHTAARALQDAADALPLPEDNWPEAPHNCRTHDLDVADWLRNRADTLNTAGEHDARKTVPRCQHTSPSPWGMTQCALLNGHEQRHAYSPSESITPPGETGDGAP